MKLPKSLLNSILIGVTTGTMAACSLADIADSPLNLIKEGISCEIEGDCPYTCGPCGMG